jgi:uncharacterized membrane protein YjjP (DUF1212 family)
MRAFAYTASALLGLVGIGLSFYLNQRYGWQSVAFQINAAVTIGLFAAASVILRRGGEPKKSYL